MQSIKKIILILLISLVFYSIPGLTMASSSIPAPNVQSVTNYINNVSSQNVNMPVKGYESASVSSFWEKINNWFEQELGINLQKLVPTVVGAFTYVFDKILSFINSFNK